MAEFEIPRETSLSLDVSAIDNTMVKIDDTHVILSYSTSSTSVIKTFSLDSQGRVVTELDALVHDGAGIAENHGSLVFIDSTHFALAHFDSASDGHIKTFSIDGSFVITQIDDLEHDTTEGKHNSLILLDSTHLALAYAGPDGDGFVKTFSFNGTTFGSITELNSLEHDTAAGTNNSLVKIDDTHLILAYSGDTVDGFFKTFAIDGSYIISEIASLEYDTVGSSAPSLVMIDSTHFFLAYSDSTTVSRIITVSIDGNYENITVLDTLIRSGVIGQGNSVVKIDGTHFILVTTIAGNDGGIVTFSINGSFVITEIDSLEHDTNNGDNNSLVMMDATHFILAYKDGSGGAIKTFTLSAAVCAPSGGNSTRGVSGSGWGW